MNKHESARTPEAFSQETRGNKVIPQIYNLIENQASTQDIVQQLSQDFYSNNLGAALLAVKELQARGNEGRAAIQFLARSTDELGKMAKKIDENFELHDQELEKPVGISRSTKYLDIHNNPNLKLSIYEYLKSKGYIPEYMGLDECSSLLKRQSGATKSGVDSHLEGGLEKDLINFSSTFGASEPCYLELLGQKEILRLRAKQTPQFLLLGSMGVYSARDIRKFADKINPDIKTNVVDIDSRSINQIKADVNPTSQPVQGDALKLPYKPGTMDNVYTNNLLDFIVLGRRDYHRVYTDLINEVSAVLNKGGSLLMIEHATRYRELNPKNSKADFENELISIANKAGLKLANKLPKTLFYLATRDNSKAVVDENGLAYYEDICLEVDSMSVSLRFEKI